MPLAALDGGLFAGAVWGLAAAALLPTLLPLPARLAPFGARFQLARLIGATASLALALAGAIALAGIEPAPLQWWPGLPGDPFALGLDSLSAPFLLLAGVLGAASFAAQQAGVPPGDGGAAPAWPRRGARVGLSLHAGLALALTAALAARQALLFLLSWEGMTLLTAALVAADSRSARARSATFGYLALSHAGTALLALGLMALSAQAHSFAFRDLAATMAALPASQSAPIAWLMTAGFAVQLGLVPVHGWLPLAHPEAPTPVSALLSGAAVKAGLYGLLRFAWQMPGVPPGGWGETLLLLGAVSAVAGAFYAVAESDAKRLLAFSTIQHAGVLAMALGTAAALAAGGKPEIAAVALAACFYHLLGHGLSKGLAFLAVGQAARAAGSRSLEALGGLARRLPRLALCALIAVLALSALPPLAGFAGQWLLFQSWILGFSAGAGAMRLLTPFAAAGLALATALSIAAMVKLYGIGFLGRPRSDGAAAARAGPAVAEWAMLALAAAGAAWGVLAPWAARALARSLATVLGPPLEATTFTRFGGLALVPVPASTASVSPLAVSLLVAGFAGLCFAWAALRGPRRAPRRAPPWTGGVRLDARTQYSAIGLTRPLRLAFGPLLGAERELEILEQGSPHPGRGSRLRSGVPPLAARLLHPALVQAVLRTSEEVRRLQAGNPHFSLACLLVTLVLLLAWAR